MSTVKDSSLYEKYPEFEVLAKQLEYANADWRPIIPEWGEINNLLGIAINQGLTGEKTPEQAMRDVVEPIRQIMIRGGYIEQ
jgi:multiple sugar transport system substrate-binding protein